MLGVARHETDCVLCQVTSNPYGDPQAVTLSSDAFAAGSLRVTSYARPTMLFTASRNLIAAEVDRRRSRPPPRRR
jgi:mRNA interferase MazF